jgi:hypothetical protein
MMEVSTAVLDMTERIFFQLARCSLKESLVVTFARKWELLDSAPELVPCQYAAWI